MYGIVIDKIDLDPEPSGQYIRPYTPMGHEAGIGIQFYSVNITQNIQYLGNMERKIRIIVYKQIKIPAISMLKIRSAQSGSTGQIERA